MKISIYRFDPAKDKKPYMKDYDVEVQGTDVMLLDLLIKIKSEDDLLSFINSNKPNQAIDLFKLDNNFPLWKNLLKLVNKELIVNQ